MKQIRIECLSEIMQELGIVVTELQLERIAEDFGNHIDMEREMSFTQHISVSNECENCKKLESRLRDAKQEIEVYSNSVKSRRKAESVWVEGDSVMYK